MSRTVTGIGTAVLPLALVLVGVQPSRPRPHTAQKGGAMVRASQVARHSGLIALLAGVLWLLSVALAAIYGDQSDTPGSFAFSLFEGVISLGYIGTLVGLFGIHAAQTPKYGRLGAIGFFLALAGTLLQAAGAVATTIAGRDALGVLFISGLLLAVVGYALLGIATLQAHTLPWWCGAILIALFPVAIGLGGVVGDIAVSLVLGLSWIALGFVLMRGNLVHSPML